MARRKFTHRVAFYVVSQIMVQRLANSLTFQRFAVRTSRKIEDVSRIMAKTRQEVAEQLKKGLKNLESFKDL